ncbi:hypothetical protein [Reyranella sp.]|uniref:hypothetical protein n=1 Tax=Reyranella sp. TaxID=1929291 RepID=UPI0037844903
MSFRPDRPVSEQIAFAKTHFSLDPAESKIMDGFFDSFDKERITELQSKYRSQIATEGIRGQFKYLDVGYWVAQKIKHYPIKLQDSPPLHILDLGCGACHFGALARYLGHTSTNLDIENTFYDDIADIFGLKRISFRIRPRVPLPRAGGPYDLVVAFAISFDSLPNVQGKRAYWSNEDWDFLIEDLRLNLLKEESRIVFQLNQAWSEEEKIFVTQTDLVNRFEGMGAMVERSLSIVDFQLSKRKRSRSRTRGKSSPFIPQANDGLDRHN